MPDEPRIVVTEHGPYRVEGEVAIHDAAGTRLETGASVSLCRCGGSRKKPFCDGTHARKGFDGRESFDHGPIAARRDAYRANGLTVYDDRAACSHFGQCTDRLASVFGGKPFVRPHGAPADAIAEIVAACPSGALAYALRDTPEPIETREPPSISPMPDGPYRVRGAVEVVGADGRPYEARERQTLCRCGQSRTKPYCDGSHWYAGFRDPLPPELADVSSFPWDDPHAAEQGRIRYAEEQAARRDG